MQNRYSDLYHHSAKFWATYGPSLLTMSLPFPSFDFDNDDDDDDDDDFDDLDKGNLVFL